MTRFAPIHTTLAACLIAIGLWEAPAQAQFHATDPAAGAELLELEQQRAEAGLAGPIVVSALGGHIFLVGVILLVEGSLYDLNVCSDDPDPWDDCNPHSLVRGYRIAGGVSMAAGAPLLAFGIPWLVRRLRERRALGRRIRELRGPMTLSALDVHLSSAGFESRLSFAF